MTIETAMWFALGFLVAAVLGLVLMASLWRRAVRLTTRRVEAGVPADAEAALARADVVAEIVSLWTAGQGGHASPPDEGLRPEDLNASNDS